MSDLHDYVPVVVGIGNPNLDYMIKVYDDYLFQKYNLLSNSQMEVSYETLASIKEDVKKSNWETAITPGGCIQNTLRIFQWLIKLPFKTVMFGSVGRDDDAATLRKQVEDTGVITEYVEIDGYKTSNIFVITYKESRTALGNIGAAAIFGPNHLTDRHLQFIRNTELILLEGFFASHSSEVCFHVIDNYTDKILLFNIGGVYIFNTPKANEISKLCKLADILIGNREEFGALAANVGLSGASISDLLKQFHKLMLSKSVSNIKPAWKWEKILIVTDGNNPINYIFNEEVMTWNVPVINIDDIVDTTGAGDSFISGFIYGILTGKDVPKSIQIGCRVSREIIMQYGVIAPNRDSVEVIDDVQ